MKIKISRVLSLVFFVLFSFYVHFEYKCFVDDKEKATLKILENFKIRDKIIVEKKMKKVDEVKKEDIKKENIEENDEKLEEKNDNEKKEEVKEKIKIEKKYIQAATFRTEEAAKMEVKRLGEGFKVNKAEINGKNVYQVISVTVDDAEKFEILENRVKKLKMKYIVRTVGK